MQRPRETVIRKQESVPNYLYQKLRIVEKYGE